MNQLIATFSLLISLNVICVGSEGPEWMVSPRQHDAYLKEKVWPKLSPKERKEAEKKWSDFYGSFSSPVNFYGIILSEDGEGVSKAKIRITVVDDSESGWTEYKTESDSQGRFRFEGLKGKALDIIIFNHFYYISRKNQMSYTFYNSSDSEYAKSDRQNPIVFRAKKRQIAEPLVSIHRDWAIPIDGTWVSFNLLAGSILNKSQAKDQVDLVVSYSRSKENAEGLVDWSLSLEVPGGKGGLIITGDEYMFLAPQEGYQKKIELKEKDFKNESALGEYLYFYICSREGKHFSRVKMSFLPFSRKRKVDRYTQEEKISEVGLLSMNYFLNPNGSRNLEYEDGNYILTKLLHGGNVESIYPDLESLKELRKEMGSKEASNEPDEIETWRDFFPD